MEGRTRHRAARGRATRSGSLKDEPQANAQSRKYATTFRGLWRTPRRPRQPCVPQRHWPRAAAVSRVALDGDESAVVLWSLTQTCRGAARSCSAGARRSGCDHQPAARIAANDDRVVLAPAHEPGRVAEAAARPRRERASGRGPGSLMASLTGRPRARKGSPWSALPLIVRVQPARDARSAGESCCTVCGGTICPSALVDQRGRVHRVAEYVVVALDDGPE